jgi:hypothetical protein
MNMINASAENGAERYTQALSKGGSLLNETRILLERWSPAETEAKLAERVLEGDALGKATARRVLDIVRVFTLRFLTPDDAPARHLKHLVERGASGRMTTDLMLFYALRRDPLLRDFVSLFYWPSVRAGRLVITNGDVMGLLSEAEGDGRIVSRWSDEIRRDMCGRVMIALTDFGLFRPMKPAVREVASYRPADETLVYIAYLLHDRGVTDAALAEADEWSWFGFEPDEVWSQLDLLSRGGWLLLQRAGDVRRISWTHGNVEGMLNVLTGA